MYGLIACARRWVAHLTEPARGGEGRGGGRLLGVRSSSPPSRHEVSHICFATRAAQLPLVQKPSRLS